jgi:predicted phosphodiesterase
MTNPRYAAVAAEGAEDPPKVSTKDVWRLAVYGDNRGKNEVHRRILHQIAKLKPEIILHMGDSVGWGDFGNSDMKSDPISAFGDYDVFKSKLWLTIGNWDEEVGVKLSEEQTEAEPKGVDGAGLNPNGIRHLKLYDIHKRAEEIDRIGDYYFVHKNIYVLVPYVPDDWYTSKRRTKDPKDVDIRLDLLSEQRSWLREHLQTIRKAHGNKVGIIIMAHDQNWYKGNEPFARYMKKLLRDYEVDLALAGDSHKYRAKRYAKTLCIEAGSAGYGEAIFLDILVDKKGMTIMCRNEEGKWWNEQSDQHAYWYKGFGLNPVPLEIPEPEEKKDRITIREEGGEPQSDPEK